MSEPIRVNGTPGDMPVSWVWKPLHLYEIDLEVKGERFIVSIDTAERGEVAESLQRLAEAVYPGDVRLIAHHRCCDNGYFGDDHECQKQDGGEVAT